MKFGLKLFDVLIKNRIANMTSVDCATTGIPSVVWQQQGGKSYIRR